MCNGACKDKATLNISDPTTTAYQTISISDMVGSSVSMKPYLEELVNRVSAALFPANVQVRHEVDDVALPRELRLL